MESPLASLTSFTTLSGGAFRSVEKDSVYSLTTPDLQHLGFCLTLNLSECPRIPIPTKLSDILEDNPDPKYRLSAIACQGILNRAANRGKALPTELEKALIAQAIPSKFGGVERDSNGRKAGKGALVQTELSGTLGVSQDQTLIETGVAEAIPLEGNGQRESHRGDGYGWPGDPCFTLNGTEHHSVCAGFTPNQSSKARSLAYQDETSPTISTGQGGNQKQCVITN